VQPAQKEAAKKAAKEAPSPATEVGRVPLPGAKDATPDPVPAEAARKAEVANGVALTAGVKLEAVVKQEGGRKAEESLPPAAQVGHDSAVLLRSGQNRNCVARDPSLEVNQQ